MNWTQVQTPLWGKNCFELSHFVLETFEVYSLFYMHVIVEVKVMN